MGFKIEQLKRIGQIYQPTAARMVNFFLHASEDTAAAVATANYFDNAAHKLKIGDVIISKGGIGGTRILQILDVTAVTPHVTTSADEVTKVANVPALTGTPTGTPNGSIVDVAATAAATAGSSTPSAAQVDAGIATAVASIVTGVNEQNAEFQAKLNALIAAAVSAGWMTAPA